MFFPVAVDAEHCNEIPTLRARVFQARSAHHPSHVKHRHIHTQLPILVKWPERCQTDFFKSLLEALEMRWGASSGGGALCGVGE